MRTVHKIFMTDHDHGCIDAAKITIEITHYVIAIHLLNVIKNASVLLCTLVRITVSIIQELLLWLRVLYLDLSAG